MKPIKTTPLLLMLLALPVTVNAGFLDKAITRSTYGVTIAKDAKIDPAIEKQTDVLINRLETRASQVRTHIAKESLSEFNSLHQAHINALKKRDFIGAYKMLGKIHMLSYSLHQESVSRNGVVIHGCCFGGCMDKKAKYVRGNLVQLYAAPDNQIYSILPSERLGNRDWNFSYSMASPLPLNAMYAFILGLDMHEFEAVEVHNAKEEELQAINILLGE